MSNAFDGFDPQKKIKELIQENSRLTADYERAIQYLEAEIAALRAALEAVEFVEMAEIHSDREGAYYSAVQMCPWCMVDYRRHTEDCIRQRALGLTKQEAKNV